MHANDSDVKLEDVKMYALKNVFVNGIYNDVAFTVKDKMIILMEHQSTINENMPIRMLLYLAEECKKWLHQDIDNEDDSTTESKKVSKNILKSKLVSIPEPEFYVVYTGDRKWNKTELKLSDAFTSKSSMSIELCVNIIHKPEDEDGSHITFLQEFILCSKSFKHSLSKGIRKEEAFSIVANQIAKSKQMRDFLNKHETELLYMLDLEYTQEDLIKVRTIEAKEEGMERGMKVTKSIFKLSLKGMSPTQIAEELGLTLEHVNKILE